MTDPTPRSSPLLSLALALSLLPLVFELGAVGLLEPEESRYGEIAREMLASGDWLVPTLREFPYLEKPPLTTWLVAFSFRVFGRNEMAARLPSLLSTLATLWFTFALGRCLRSTRFGMMSVIVLATSPLLFGLARLVSTDAPFLAAITAGLYFLVQMRQRTNRLDAIWLGVAAALAMLTKGPLGVLLLGLAALALALTERDWRTLFRCCPWPTIVTFLVLGVPWFVLVTQRHPSFPAFFFGKHHLARFFASEEVKDLHSEPAHYYLPVIVGGLVPWAWFAPLALRQLRHDTADGSRARLSAVWLWALLTLLFFSFGSGKRVPYVLPMWPAMALGIAALLDSRYDGLRSRGLFLSWLPMGLVAIAALLPVWNRPDFTDYLDRVGVVRPAITVVLLAGFLLVAWFLHRARVEPAVLMISLMASAALLLVIVALQRLEPRLSMKSVVCYANATAPKDAPLVAFPRYRPGISYYSDRPVLVVGAPHELDYGMSLLADKASPVIDDRFADYLARPSSFVLVGSTDKIKKKMAEWRAIAAQLTIEEFGEWSVVRN